MYRAYLEAVVKAGCRQVGSLPDYAAAPGWFGAVLHALHEYRFKFEGKTYGCMYKRTGYVYVPIKGQALGTCRWWNAMCKDLEDRIASEPVYAPLRVLSLNLQCVSCGA